MATSSGVVVEIPVLANVAGDCVRVRIATTVQAVLTAPEAASRLWRIVRDVPNEDLPLTVETPPRPHGSRVWYTAAAYDNGVRVSNYRDAEFIDIPHPYFLFDFTVGDF